MAWVPIAAAVAGSVASSAMNNGGKGSATAPGGGYSLSMYEKMPPALQERFIQEMSGMPGSVRVGFGGYQYPGIYGPLMRSSKALFTPEGGAKMGDAQPSALAGGLAAAAPWMWQAANNANMYNFNSPGVTSMGQTGAYMNPVYVPPYADNTPSYYDPYYRGGGYSGY